jgi:hypothetical protein
MKNMTKKKRKDTKKEKMYSRAMYALIVLK